MPATLQHTSERVPSAPPQIERFWTVGPLALPGDRASVIRLVAHTEIIPVDIGRRHP